MGQSAKGFTLVEIMIVVVIIGLLAAMAIPNFAGLSDRAREANTRENAHILQLAAEDFSIRNGGIYSIDPGDLTPLLPGGGLMANLFTGAYSEPQFNVAAAAPGQVGIEPVIIGGNIMGYEITAEGKEGNILTLTSGK